MVFSYSFSLGGSCATYLDLPGSLPFPVFNPATATLPSNTHTQTHTNTHKHTRKHTRTRTHTYTNAHTERNAHLIHTHTYLHRRCSRSAADHAASASAAPTSQTQPAVIASAGMGLPPNMPNFNMKDLEFIVRFSEVGGWTWSPSVSVL